MQTSIKLVLLLSFGCFPTAARHFQNLLVIKNHDQMHMPRSNNFHSPSLHTLDLLLSFSFVFLSIVRSFECPCVVIFTEHAPAPNLRYLYNDRSFICSIYCRCVDKTRKFVCYARGAYLTFTPLASLSCSSYTVCIV